MTSARKLAEMYLGVEDQGEVALLASLVELAMAHERERCAREAERTAGMQGEDWIVARNIRALPPEEVT